MSKPQLVGKRIYLKWHDLINPCTGCGTDGKYVYIYDIESLSNTDKRDKTKCIFKLYNYDIKMPKRTFNRLYLRMNCP